MHFLQEGQIQIGHTHTRERLIDCAEFRADTISSSALRHIRTESTYKEAAIFVNLICCPGSKDLMSSEAKYRASCYKNVVKIMYKDEVAGNMPSGQSEEVNKFSERLIKHLQIIKFKNIRKMVDEQAGKLYFQLPPSFHKNLLRKLKSSFPEMKFVQRWRNCVLVYPESLSVDNLVLEYHNLSLDFEALNTVYDEREKTVLKAGLLIHNAIESHPEYMSWTSTDEELKAENVIKYIPSLLNSFLKTLFHGQANVKEESHRISQRRNSIAQDIVYCVSEGRSRTPKYLEVIKMINTFGHGINYNLIREIETEHALMAICMCACLSVACFCLSRVSVCRVFLSVACFCLSRVSVCRVFLSVACFCLSRVSVCRVFLSVACFCLSRVSVCRVYLSVACFCLSCVGVRACVRARFPSW